MVGNESPLGLSPEIAMDHHEIGGGPLSPSKDTKYPQRRAGHIHAEQKRRYNIKNGFDVLQSLIPQLQQNPTAKVALNSPSKKFTSLVVPYSLVFLLV